MRPAACMSLLAIALALLLCPSTVGFRLNKRTVTSGKSKSTDNPIAAIHNASAKEDSPQPHSNDLTRPRPRLAAETNPLASNQSKMAHTLDPSSQQEEDASPATKHQDRLGTVTSTKTRHARQQQEMIMAAHPGPVRTEAGKIEELLHQTASVDGRGSGALCLPIMWILSISVAVCALVVWQALTLKSRQKSQWEAKEQQQKNNAIWSRLFDLIELKLVRACGKELVTVNAERCWSCQYVKEVASQSIAADEYVHSLVLSDGAVERILDDRETIAHLGLKDGSEIRAIMASYSTMPSHVSHFSYTRSTPGTLGSFMRASIWIHEDNSASMECVNCEDVGTNVAVYLEGCLDAKSGTLQFQSDDQVFAGCLERMSGRFSIKDLSVPVLGPITLQQSAVEASFDLQHHPLFEGWMVFFQSGEVVAKVASRATPEHSACLRLKASINPSSDLTDSATHIFFRKDADFQDWTETLAHGHGCHTGTRTEYSGSWLGQVGQRKLTLVDFPILGSIELVESLL